MGIVTDSTPVEAPKPVENSTVLALYKLFAGETEYNAMVEVLLAGGTGYGEFKKRLWEAYWGYFAKMRERRAAILADTGYVDVVLARGAERAPFNGPRSWTV